LGLLTSHEFRLVFALLLNALVLWGAWRAARRFNEDPLDSAGDSGLLFYLVQYVSVCVPGLVGALHPLTIGAVAVLVSAGIGVVGLRRSLAPQSPPIALGGLSNRLALIASTLFVLGYLLALIWHQRQVPVLSNDAITYHLPAAVQWLQTGRLGLYEAWFYNPANSYSPLAGSAFIAWLMAPFGNDVAARFVQAGPLVLLLIGMINLCRRMGATTGVAALIAAATVLARPLMSQTILAKDDLFVAAFFVLAVDALSRQRLETRIGPWRAGIAIGLLLATKYTVLLSMPIFLLMLGRGWNWRHIAIIVGCAIVLAGPWYLRNILLTGNPLYPTFGMLNVGRSALLTTPRGAWDVFTAGYYGIPPLLALILIAGWLAAARHGLRDRLRRTAILGPVIGIALFVALAPYGEMRFAYPSVVLLFAACAIALSDLPKPAGIALAACLAATAAATAFRIQMSASFLIAGMVAVAIGTLVAMNRTVLRYGAVAAGLAIALYGYVYWAWYINQMELDSVPSWSVSEDEGAYGQIGEVWGYVRNELPKGTTIAYANTYFTYPLMGFAYDHRVVHAATRHNLERFVDMPAIQERITGEEIVGHVVKMLGQDPDRAQWLDRLRRTGAQYLVVGKTLKETRDNPTPPEMTFAQSDPERFTKLFENEAGVVYQIRQ
jgi:hypothetical protein